MCAKLVYSSSTRFVILDLTLPCNLICSARRFFEFRAVYVELTAELPLAFSGMTVQLPRPGQKGNTHAHTHGDDITMTIKNETNENNISKEEQQKEMIYKKVVRQIKRMW